MAKENTVMISLIVRPEQAAFILAASKSQKIPRSLFMRNAMLQGASKELGKPIPDSAPFVAGRNSPIGQAAKELGLTIQQYLRQVANEKLGIKAPASKAKKAKRAKK